MRNGSSGCWTRSERLTPNLELIQIVRGWIRPAPVLHLTGMKETNMTKCKKRIPTIELTAYHEAGHAVMCFLLKQRFRHVTVVPRKESLGHIDPVWAENYWKDIEWSPNPAKVEKEIKILLGGVVAEAIRIGRDNWKWDGSDIQKATDFAFRAHGTSHTGAKYIDFLLSSVRDVLDQPPNKVMVQELAKALLREKTIGYRKAREIMRRANNQHFEAEMEKANRIHRINNGGDES